MVRSIIFDAIDLSSSENIFYLDFIKQIVSSALA